MDVVVERRIPSPRSEVAAYATDPVNDPDWISGITETVTYEIETQYRDNDENTRKKQPWSESD